MGKTLIVGGYGKVGGIITGLLSKTMPGNIVIAGRNRDRAHQWVTSRSLETVVSVLDLSRKGFRDSLTNDIKRVIMCVDQENPDFPLECIARGIDYLDITASFPIFNAIRMAKFTAKRTGCIAVLGSGLAPGLTNLMVAEGCREVPNPTSATIDIILSLNSDHGKAAINWIVDKLYIPYFPGGEGRILVPPYSILHDFTDDSGHTFEAGNLDFADQHMVIQSLGLKSCTTYLGFISRRQTRMLNWASRWKLLHLLKDPVIRGVTIKAFGRPSTHDDSFTLHTCCLSICFNQIL
ncbi:MAG: hypothetical protein P1P77_13920, partial [Spirochaetaceae bacterium]|nr:hypothetical protein [Spirochaetaceae bacterium]